MLVALLFMSIRVAQRLSYPIHLIRRLLLLLLRQVMKAMRNLVTVCIVVLLDYMLTLLYVMMMAGVRKTLKARKKANMIYESYRSGNKIENTNADLKGRMREVGGRRNEMRSMP
jgi:hypothetical protein